MDPEVAGWNEGVSQFSGTCRSESAGQRVRIRECESESADQRVRVRGSRMCAGQRVRGPACVRVREFRELGDPHVCGSESSDARMCAGQRVQRVG
jgi:hypothetical protein